MTDPSNAAQRDYWNHVAGPKWVRLREIMDARMQRIDDLLRAAAGPTAGERVLEIGCGTGTSTLALAEAVGARGHVAAIDISEPMLAVAHRRIAERGRANVSLLLADAQVHEFASAEFDLLVSRFGVMFFADPVAAFRNLLRAARPGARLCFVCWAALAENPHWQIPLDIIASRLGPPAAQPAHAPGPLAFSDPAYVTKILVEAGFEAVAIARKTPSIIGATPEAETAFACMSGPASSLLDQRNADDATRAEIQQTVAQAFARYASGGALLLPASVHLVTGRRPVLDND